MNKRANIFIATLAISIVAIFATFVSISFIAKDPHWLNRGGALIAAIGAVAIIFQIKYEIEIDKEKKKTESDDVLPSHEEFESPLDRTTFILHWHQMQRKNRALTKERLRISAIVVVCALSGELLHGFGDLLLLNLFAAHFIR